jgi:putative spermidine/putrescine transport system ATP-binding protein
MNFLTVENLTVGYRKGEPILKNINIDVSKGEFLSILGPSGCGKTTFLRTLMGFLRPSSGKIFVENKDYTYIPPHKRNFGIVFQSYALFPHLTVFDNVAFGLQMRKMPKQEIKKRVENALQMVGLSGLEQRLPRQLSGGQAQRVALARALVIEPKLLLLDEPLSNLDAKLRAEMRTELRRLQKELNITSVYVTHDQAEALALSDRIAILNKGQIEQLGTPKEIYFEPQNEFVADFIGFTNRIKGYVVSQDNQFVHVKIGENTIYVLRRAYAFSPRSEVVLAIRPSSIELLSAATEENVNVFFGKISMRIFQGERSIYVVTTNIGDLFIENLETRQSFKENEEVIVKLPVDKIVVFPL